MHNLAISRVDSHEPRGLVTRGRAMGDRYWIPKKEHMRISWGILGELGSGRHIC